MVYNEKLEEKVIKEKYSIEFIDLLKNINSMF